MQEVLALYDQFDSTAAVETSPDKVFGSFREHQFEPQSGWLRKAKIASALRLAAALELHFQPSELPDTHWCVEHWLPELRILDELQPNDHYFNGAVTTAALLTLRRYGATAHDFGNRAPPDRLGGNTSPEQRAARVVEFWDRYNRNQGSKPGPPTRCCGTSRIKVCARTGQLRTEADRPICARRLRRWAPGALFRFSRPAQPPAPTRVYGLPTRFSESMPDRAGCEIAPASGRIVVGCGNPDLR